jgi:hypothetical protein
MAADFKAVFESTSRLGVFAGPALALANMIVATVLFWVCNAGFVAPDLLLVGTLCLVCASVVAAGSGGSVCKPTPSKAAGSQRCFRGSFSWLMLLVGCALTPNASDAAPHSALRTSAGANISGDWKDSAIAALATVVLVLVVFTCVGKKIGAAASAGGNTVCKCTCSGCRKDQDNPNEVVAFDVEVRVALLCTRLRFLSMFW